MTKYTFPFCVEELIEKNRTTIEDIEHLEEWLTTRDLPKLVREQIVIYLLSCDNDREKTKKTIKSNYALKSALPHMFTDRSALNPALAQILDVIGGYELPHRINGCIVALCKLNDTNYRSFNFDAYVKLVTSSLDTMCFRKDPPEGLILVLNSVGCTARHVTQIKIGTLRWFMRYVQEAIPIKLKTIHIINSSSAMEMGFNLVKPLIKNDIVQNIHFHSTANMELFYKNHISKEHLPKDFGGHLKAISDYRQEGIDRINAMQEYYKFEEQQRKDLVEQSTWI